MMPLLLRTKICEEEGPLIDIVLWLAQLGRTQSALGEVWQDPCEEKMKVSPRLGIVGDLKKVVLIPRHA